MTGSMIDSLLVEQRTLTAVEQFSQRHDSGELVSKKYRDLIPSGGPGESQQYAFEVDLDACSGCKACVAACHNLNGLDEHETWRSVGQLVGGTSQLPIVHHVTAACHHCLEPACLAGCPVKAYEKDPATGIVRHLDDQCIGCQYCTLTCPYEVPIYNHRKGIVRKCDMCQQRLAVGEAPACVQSCPNQAIRIRIVDSIHVREDAEVHNFLPGAPDPALTFPTTVYKSARPLPKNLLPADYFRVHLGHGHLSLVWMLVLTQMSVGAFVFDQALHRVWLTDASSPAIDGDSASSLGRLVHLIAALVFGGLGLAVGTFHLGRPLYAFRAILGLRTSWLSREMLGFGLFAMLAAAYVFVSACQTFGWDRQLGVTIPTWLPPILGYLASLSGIGAVLTSVMIYVATRRPMWTLGTTTARFTQTVLLLGLPATWLISLIGAAVTDPDTITVLLQRYGYHLCRFTFVCSAIKLGSELTFLLHLRDPQLTARKRAAQLMVGELSMVVLRRYFFGILGGLVLPGIQMSESWISSERFHPLFVLLTAALSLLLLFISELHERYLFFTASVSPRMPGVPS